MHFGFVKKKLKDLCLTKVCWSLWCHGVRWHSVIKTKFELTTHRHQRGCQMFLFVNVFAPLNCLLEKTRWYPFYRQTSPLSFFLLFFFFYFLVSLFWTMRLLLHEVLRCVTKLHPRLYAGSRLWLGPLFSFFDSTHWPWYIRFFSRIFLPSNGYVQN